MLPVDDIQATLTDFVVSNYLFGNSESAPRPQDSLIGAGVIDSTGILELIEFLEERFGIEVSEDETIPENLDSLIRLAAFIERKSSSK